jgi:hypothetical protein
LQHRPGMTSFRRVLTLRVELRCVYIH